MMMMGKIDGDGYDNGDENDDDDQEGKIMVMTTTMMLTMIAFKGQCAIISMCARVCAHF